MKQTTKMAEARAKKYSLDLARYYRRPATQVSLAVVLSVFVMMFFVVVALRPTFVTITKLNTEIESSQKILKQLTAKSSALEQAAKMWQVAEPLVPYLDSSIPEGSSNYDLLTKSIELLAQEAGVKITSLVVGKSLIYSQGLDIYEGRKQDVVEMELSVRVVGEFEQNLEFLSQVLEMDRLVNVESLTINKEIAVADSSNVGMAISGSIGYLADSVELDKVLNEEGGKR